MAEQQEMGEEDVVMLPATFDFETTLAGDSSDDDFQSMPEADMGILPDFEDTSDAKTKVAVELPVQGQMSLDGKDRSNDGKEEDMEVIKVRGGQLEVVIHPLPAHLRGEYVPIKPGYEVYKVLGPIASLPGESWWSLEYEDGRVDQVRTKTSYNLAKSTIVLSLPLTNHFRFLFPLSCSTFDSIYLENSLPFPFSQEKHSFLEQFWTTSS